MAPMPRARPDIQWSDVKWRNVRDLNQILQTKTEIKNSGL